MNLPVSPLASFFHAFERASNTADVHGSVSQFADTFMVAGPQGAQCVRASDFAVALPQRKQYFDSLGCRSTALAALEEIRIDDRYVMAKTRWRMTFVQGEAAPKEVLADSAFLVDVSGEAFKIVLYLAGKDYQTLLRDHGILRD